MPNNATLMEAAAEVARVAGDVANRYFRAAIQTELKADGSPVTIADREAERAARDWLAQRFRGDAIIGEEFGGTEVTADRAWIVDPIDGTKTFIRGVPLWGTLVGVSVRGAVVAGAAYFPALGELLHAAVGEGCWWNGSRARVSEVAALDKAMVVTTDECFHAAPERRRSWTRLADHASMSRSWGDCYGYLLVATGRAEVMTDGKLSMWDAAALYPAITEAGGVFTDWTGSATPFGGSAIATNAALAGEVRAILMER
jgi:histidinol phosphatase-like enzyme (inositol monophosphatase family)